MVYRRVTVHSAQGDLLSEDVLGELTLDIIERSARPQLHVDEPVVYEDHVWRQELADGTIERGREIIAVPHEPTAVALDPEPFGLSSSLTAQLEGTAPDEPIPVLIRVPRGDLEILPMVPTAQATTPALQAAAAAAATTRAQLIDANAAAFAESNAALVTHIEAVGGEVASLHWTVGMISATVPRGTLDDLAENPAVLGIQSVGSGQDACTNAAGGQPAGDPVSLGDLRAAMGVDDFLGDGHDGELAGGQPLMVGIHEHFPPEDEGCFWVDGSTCNLADSRLEQRFDCTVAGCDPETNYAQGDERAHGARVSSVLVGDYSDGQASNTAAFVYPPQTLGWEEEASGIAQEAHAHYYAVGGDPADKVDAFDCARGVTAVASECETMDAVSSQNSIIADACDSASQSSLEGAVEGLYYEGVFTAIATDNDNHYYNGGSDTCRVYDPADIPLAFGVGALEPDDSLPYDEWRYAGYSNRGGGGVVSGGLYHPNAQTMVDLVASGFPGFMTTQGGLWGVVEDAACDPSGFAHAGTSFATPQVAGAALLLKHRLLDDGQTWIENTGRLHTMMLAMGDRATNTDTGAQSPTIPSCVITGGIGPTRLRCGGDHYYGFGRLKLGRHDTYYMRSRTLTDSTPVTQWVFTRPLRADKVMFKCVMQQEEAMASKIDISQVGLKIRLADPNPANDRCEYWGGGMSFTYQLEDDSFDDKHMVAVFDAENDITDKCIELTQTAYEISSAGSATTYTYCYADTELDY